MLLSSPPKKRAAGADNKFVGANNTEHSSPSKKRAAGVDNKFVGANNTEHSDSSN